MRKPAEFKVHFKVNERRNACQAHWLRASTRDPKAVTCKNCLTSVVFRDSKQAAKLAGVTAKDCGWGCGGK